MSLIATGTHFVNFLAGTNGSSFADNSTICGQLHLQIQPILRKHAITFLSNKWTDSNPLCMICDKKFLCNFFSGHVSWAWPAARQRSQTCRARKMLLVHHSLPQSQSQWLPSGDPCSDHCEATRTQVRESRSCPANFKVPWSFRDAQMQNDHDFRTRPSDLVPHRAQCSSIFIPNVQAPPTNRFTWHSHGSMSIFQSAAQITGILHQAQAFWVDLCWPVMTLSWPSQSCRYLVP